MTGLDLRALGRRYAGSHSLPPRRRRKPRHLAAGSDRHQTLVAAGFARRRSPSLPGLPRNPRLQSDVVRSVASLDRGPVDHRRTGDSCSVQLAIGAVSGAAGLASGERGSPPTPRRSKPLVRRVCVSISNGCAVNRLGRKSQLAFDFEPLSVTASDLRGCNQKRSTHLEINKYTVVCISRIAPNAIHPNVRCDSSIQSYVTKERSGTWLPLSLHTQLL